MNKEKLLEYAKTSDERIMLSRVIDVSSYVEKNHQVKTTQFLNGHELVLAQKVLSKTGVCFSAYGGYVNSERKIIACYPDYTEVESCDFPITILEMQCRELQKLSHRDFLGAILALGIKREKVGDIVISDHKAFVFCMSDIADYIFSQLEKIGSETVKLKICNDNSQIVSNEKHKDIIATVSSLRLDSIISAAVKISRSDVVDIIKQGRVTVDWETTLSPSKNVEKGQIVSVKGIGRMALDEIKGQTKKGRTAVIIKMFI